MIGEKYFYNPIVNVVDGYYCVGVYKMNIFGKVKHIKTMVSLSYKSALKRAKDFVKDLR